VPHPSPALRARLLAFADELARAGQEAPSRALRATVEAWWKEEQTWLEGVVNVLRIHHDINNALVGVRGNAQLLLMAPVAEQPNVRDRLEVIVRESTRIQEAAMRINELKASITGAGPSARAA
jgi:nitrogen-specific signal transduction histidine kinase